MARHTTEKAFIQSHLLYDGICRAVKAGLHFSVTRVTEKIFDIFLRYLIIKKNIGHC